MRLLIQGFGINRDLDQKIMGVNQFSIVDAPSHRSKGHLSRALSRLFRKKIAVTCIIILVVVYSAGILAAWISPYEYTDIDYTSFRSKPEFEMNKGLVGFWRESHFAGTDRAGRDQFTRVLWGIQNTIVLTVIGMLTGGLIIGVTLGLISGYFGKKIDALIMRIGELVTMIPTFFLVIILAATLRPRIRSWIIWVEDNPVSVGYGLGVLCFLTVGVLVFIRFSKQWVIFHRVGDYVVILVMAGLFLGLITVQFSGQYVVGVDGLLSSGIVDYVVISVALVIFGWFSTARLVRGQVLFLKETQYVEAARAIGASTPRILMRHILPNAVSPIVVMVTMGMGTMVGVEIFLSWVGLGIQPPRPSLGLMLWESGHISVLRNTPWLLIAPGIASWLMIFSWTLLGDALNDVLNPRTR